MKIKQESGERYLTFCAWQSDPDCIDKGTSTEKAKRIMAEINANVPPNEKIKGISHSLCSRCASILEAIDEYKRNHSK